MIQFRLKELIAEKERLEDSKVTYRDIQEATGINLNTLTAMAKNDMKQVHLSTIERLCNYFDCPLDSLMVLDVMTNPQQKFRMQLYDRIGRHIEQQRILPKNWALPKHLDYAIRVEIPNIPRNMIWSLFYIFKNGPLVVGLSVKTRDQQKNQNIFDQLKARRDEIEKAFGNPIDWKSPALIRYELPRQYLDRQDRWPEIQAEMIATWERMLEAFMLPLTQIWSPGEPVTRKGFSFESDITPPDQEKSVLNINDRIKEYKTIMSCDLCIRQADTVILRNNDNIPQPGHIGNRHEQHRVLLIPQNPGYAKPQRTIQHQRYAEAEKIFLSKPTQDNMENLQSLLEQAMPYWTIYAQVVSPLLTRCDLTLADIAYFNAVRCPTINNSTPSTIMVANCKFHLDHWLEWLQPEAVVCIGKKVYRDVRPILTRYNIPHTYINRDRSLSGVERMKNMDEVARFVRAMIGKPALDGKPLPPPADINQTGEKKIFVPTVDRSQDIEDTELELTAEERLALEKIKSETLKKIYLDLIDFSKKLKNVDARQVKSGNKLSFRYFSYRKYPFSFIVNQYHLLFYIRGSALRNLPFIEEELKQDNIPFEYNPSGEMQIRISDESPVTFIKELLAEYYTN
jgi:putative transcriptional regulator